MVIQKIKEIFLNFFALLLFCFCFNATSAQNDSLIVAHAKWSILHVSPGITLKQYWFNNNLFNSNQNINIVEIKLSRKNKVHIAYEPKLLKPTHDFANERNALAGINGTFFNMKNGGSEDYIRYNDSTINISQLKNGERNFHQQSAITINNNKINILKWDSSSNWEEKLKGREVMVTGPLLINNNEQMVSLTKTGFFARNPRSVIAIRKKKLYFIAVDGRNEKAAGMSIDELTLLMHWLKFTKAINLDGGGSTTLWVKNYAYNGVVNHPSDNHQWLQTNAYKQGMDLDKLPADTTKWDHTGERPVANVILIQKGK